MGFVTKWENVLWGVGIILAGVGTYIIALIDGDATTTPDFQILIVAITVGIGKMRSATATSVETVKNEVITDKVRMGASTGSVEESKARMGMNPNKP